MRFIDLFAGLGCFHVAMSRLGHRCVFACEINDDLRRVYNENFGILPAGDIRRIPIESIPAHDILCAGFPCQPFSKAGDQQGFGCPRWGDLFEYIFRILSHHRPKFIILENVPNVLKHSGGATWARIEESLRSLGYDIAHDRLSPHQFGIPQVRERLFVAGAQRKLPQGFSWPKPLLEPNPDLRRILDRNPVGARPISAQVRLCLEVWQDFVRAFPQDEQLPSFPIWSMEFGATYPYRDRAPLAQEQADLSEYTGSHGTSLAGLSVEDVALCLPSYARQRTGTFPQWKVAFIRQNRDLYERHRNWIDPWLPRILQFPPSLQKLEWNCKGGVRDVWRYVLQFRASGVRIKRPTTAPSLIAMTSTQVPIVAWESRYMTPRECARLQSLPDTHALPDTATAAYAALGNAVNVELVTQIARPLLDRFSADHATNGHVAAELPLHRQQEVLALPLDG